MRDQIILAETRPWLFPADDSEFWSATSVYHQLDYHRRNLDARCYCSTTAVVATAVSLIYLILILSCIASRVQCPGL
jgi:hypothetical protein